MDELTLMRDMTDTQRVLFQAETLKQRKSVGVAAVLAILGPIGTHRFYLGHIWTGLVMLGLTCTGFGLVVTVPWAIIDLCRISTIVGELNYDRAAGIARRVKALDGPTPALAAPDRSTRTLAIVAVLVALIAIVAYGAIQEKTGLGRIPTQPVSVR